MTWTPDRPTKPGRYEVCFGPPRGFDGYRVWVVEVWREHPSGKLLARRGILDIPIEPDPGDIDTLTEALWRPYVEPPDPFAEPVPKLVEQLPSDAELVKSAIRLMRTPRRRYSRTASQRPLWSRVMLLFGHGSTYSRAICRAHGFDPDEVWMIEETPQ